MDNDVLTREGCVAAQSWYELYSEPPRDPLDLIASASIVGGFGTDTGVYLNSGSYRTPPIGWSAGALPIAGVPVCAALETDNLQSVADAAQWNFDHLTWDSNPLLAPSLQTTLFMRAGDRWKMTIPLNLGVLVYPEFQISFVENAATRGDCQGTIPVISFTARTYAGAIALEITFKNITGRFRIGIRAIGGPMTLPTNWYMWEGIFTIVQ